MKKPRKPHPKLRTCHCGHKFRSYVLDECKYCASLKTPIYKTPYYDPKDVMPRVAPRMWQRTTDEETLQDIRYVVSKFVDLGDSGPVTIYRAGQPEFEALKRQYGSL